MKAAVTGALEIIHQRRGWHSFPLRAASAPRSPDRLILLSQVFPRDAQKEMRCSTLVGFSRSCSCYGGIVSRKHVEQRGLGHCGSWTCALKLLDFEQILPNFENLV